MMIALSDTDSASIAAEFVRARTRAGSPAMGMVLTMVIVAPEEHADQAMEMAREASHEHPARVLGVILGDARGSSQVDAQVGTGSGWTGETALIRLTGEVVKHPDSVVLPLLLPDSPVAVWWPTDAPADPATDPLGKLAQRRITDSANVTRGKSQALRAQCNAYTPGNTDLAWTRLTPWRALLAAALDQHPLKVSAATVTAERVNPSADLLTAWLRTRLKVDAVRKTSSGPGITAVEMMTAEGPIRISRPDGGLATYSSPGHPDRPIALRRRDVHELLSEELRRLDEDDIYAAVARTLVRSRSL
jgi:glucose-6-phosphate dehydrogenase assembly protein OpcA